MPAFTLIQTLTTGDAAGYWGPAGQFFRRRFSSGQLERWLDRHGGAIGCIAVVVTFIGAVDLVKHVLTAL